MPISIILRVIPIEIPKKYKIEAPNGDSRRGVLGDLDARCSQRFLRSRDCRHSRRSGKILNYMRTNDLKWRYEMSMEHIGLGLLDASDRGHASTSSRWTVRTKKGPIKWSGGYNRAEAMAFQLSPYSNFVETTLHTRSYKTSGPGHDSPVNTYDHMLFSCQKPCSGLSVHLRSFAQMLLYRREN